MDTPLFGRSLGFGLGGYRFATRLASAWFLLGCVQAALGAATVWSNKSADIATAHVAVGALILALGGLVTLLTWRSARVSGSVAGAEGLPRSVLQPGGMVLQ